MNEDGTPPGGVTRRRLIGAAAATAAATTLPARAKAASKPKAAAAQSATADVVVVGAGLAGLTAARGLVDAGRSVVVLEARDRVGGRTLNHDIGEGKVVEVGGQWVGPTQHRLLALAAELGVETFPTYNQGENVVEVSDEIKRYRGAIPRINPA